MPILEAEGLVKTYGSRRVVDGVGFSVDFAEIVGLLGPNGAGRTTSFRMTCGMIEPDRGRVTLNDIDASPGPCTAGPRKAAFTLLARNRASSASSRSSKTCWMVSGFSALYGSLLRVQLPGYQTTEDCCRRSRRCCHGRRVCRAARAGLRRTHKG